MQRRGFFSKHAKSSAALISVGIHALFILVALSFVAVKVIQKEDKSFESRTVNRPKMQLKKLQVPVSIKRKRVQPKLRKRIVVQPRMSQSMPDIRMPEISGIRGGLGEGEGGSIGGAGGVGFSMPEIEVFGVKGKGEKICIILDSSPEIMDDQLGGIPAYTIIKEELVRILNGLPSTALFNIIVYDIGQSYMLFPNMVPAGSANVAKVDEWLSPLNAVRPGMGSKEYGVSTLGSGGIQITEDMRVDVFQYQREWYRPAMAAMKQQADAVFLLTCWWGNQWHNLEEYDERWRESAAGRRYFECYEKAKVLLAQENKERAARGEPPRVIRDHHWEMNKAYFPEIEFPPVPPRYHYTARDFVKAMLEIRNRHRPTESRTRSGLQKTPSKSKVDFSFNVVHFRVREDTSDTQRMAWRDEHTESQFRELTGLAKGEYRSLAGLEAIQSYVSASE